eukprot:Opistho-1_new@72966
MIADSIIDAHFAPVREADVSRAMTARYMRDLLEGAETDVVVVGSGPSGLVCAYELSKNPNIRVSIIEASVAPGGGAWVGGQLFSTMVVRKPADALLDELEIPYEDKGSFVVVGHAALFTSAILSALLRRPNVRLFNATAVEDLVIRNGVVCGVVTNWALVTRAHGTQSCMDPQVIEARVVVSSCGHDGPFGATGVRRLEQLGLVKKVPGMGALDMNASEDALVAATREIVPGMVITGMEVAEIDGLPRMGASFGGVMVSGLKAARVAAAALERAKQKPVMA